jgi:adenylyltransferase/sulfurtransferase
MQDQITAPELQAAIAKGDKIVLLDVREPPEFTYTALQGSTNIPLAQLAQRLGELDASAPCVVICHHGIRSARACGLLRQSGFQDVKNLAGGLAAYARVDSTIKHY